MSDIENNSEESQEEHIEEDDGNFYEQEQDVFSSERESVKTIQSLKIENKELNRKNEKLKENLKEIQKALEDKTKELETKTNELKMPEKKQEPEKLPWDIRLTKKDRDCLTSNNINKHISLLKKFLKGYAVCLNISENYWLWYNWVQKLWVSSSAEGMLPLVTHIVAKFEKDISNLELDISKKLLRPSHLLDLIRNLNVFFLDENISSEINKNRSLVSLENGKVAEISPSNIRDRVRTDYFSIYYKEGKIQPSKLEDLPKQIILETPPDSFDLFLRSGIISITNDPTHKTPCGPLHAEFCEWCEENGHSKLTPRQFTDAVRNQGVDKKRFTSGYSWIGVKKQV